MDEEVEAEALLAAAVVGAEEQGNEFRRQTVPESLEGVAELCQVDVAIAVAVEAIEELAPREKEAPQSALEGEEFV